MDYTTWVVWFGDPIFNWVKQDKKIKCHICLVACGMAAQPYSPQWS